MRFIITIAIMVCLFGSVSAQAQGKTTRAGIGVSLSSDATGLGYYLFYGFFRHSIPCINVPIEFGKNFRLEPELGYYQYSSKSYGPSPTQITEKFRGYRVGLSGSYLIPNAGGSEQMQASFGARLAIHGFHTEDQYMGSGTVQSREADRTDIAFGGFVGAEYFPVKEFSAGGELGLTVIAPGEPTTSPEDINFSTPDGLAMGLYGSLRIRWFIW